MKMSDLRLTWLVLALGEGVAEQWLRAAAHRTVIDDLTHRTVAAHAGTRVYTLVVDTCAVACAVCADHTLGTAAGRHR